MQAGIGVSGPENQVLGGLSNTEFEVAWGYLGCWAQARGRCLRFISRNVSLGAGEKPWELGALAALSEDGVWSLTPSQVAHDHRPWLRLQGFQCPWHLWAPHQWHKLTHGNTHNLNIINFVFKTGSNYIDLAVLELTT